MSPTLGAPADPRRAPAAPLCTEGRTAPLWSASNRRGSVRRGRRDRLGAVRRGRRAGRGRVLLAASRTAVRRRQDAADFDVVDDVDEPFDAPDPDVLPDPPDAVEPEDEDEDDRDAPDPDEPRESLR